MTQSLENFRAFRAAVPLARHREVLDYWLGIRGDRRLPGRQDIRPEEIARPLLSHLGLVDVLPDGRFRFRLIGTALVRFYGRDYTGRIVEDAKAAGYADVLNRLYRLCAERRAVVYSETRSCYRQGFARLMHRLLLPLARDGEAVDMILFSTVPGPVVSGRDLDVLRQAGGDDILAIDPNFHPLVAAA